MTRRRGTTDKDFGDEDRERLQCQSLEMPANADGCRWSKKGREIEDEQSEIGPRRVFGYAKDRTADTRYL
ncbi:uncharacterized protein ACLA_022190 [Aspergillus clavatus NRRL 1]|uniref:Uncharacterized protein n=1 Tax=Aspergillus clavatus (strain ATCC 1007 / CBS 513.65 / DSM 816 / NCTC 3887 / NRRL 1 / QM 1276 / 107) TaxID=344612 RepID=A1CPD4_ASPCL|nr:uncharacterized protein ACLA_022190 [Aspergillus clavatus NRRL 1]EAW07505.1 hypothetical protein ACLA_022190 [Aspergillus clavatus NRRL 1]